MRETRCADTSAIVRRTADGVSAHRRCVPVNSYHGGLTPPALVLRCERLSAKNDFCDGLTLIRKSGERQPAVGVGNALATPIPLTSGDTRHVRRQERRASARRGYRYRTCSGASTKLLQTPDGACADRRCIRVQAYHGGLTPPALVLLRERSPAKKTIFAMHKRTSGRGAAGVSPPWVAERACNRDLCH